MCGESGDIYNHMKLEVNYLVLRCLNVQFLELECWKSETMRMFLVIFGIDIKIFLSFCEQSTSFERVSIRNVKAMLIWILYCHTDKTFEWVTQSGLLYLNLQF